MQPLYKSYGCACSTPPVVNVPHQNDPLHVSLTPPVLSFSPFDSVSGDRRV